VARRQLLAGGIARETIRGLMRAGALRPSPPSITTPIKGRRRPASTHHAAQLPADEITIHDEIPTTSVARTLLDLAAILDPHRLGGARRARCPPP
jgi:hypothetical protein